MKDDDDGESSAACDWGRKELEGEGEGAGEVQNPMRLQGGSVGSEGRHCEGTWADGFATRGVAVAMWWVGLNVAVPNAGMRGWVAWQLGKKGGCEARPCKDREGYDVGRSPLRGVGTTCLRVSCVRSMSTADAVELSVQEMKYVDVCRRRKLCRVHGRAGLVSLYLQLPSWNGALHYLFSNCIFTSSCGMHVQNRQMKYQIFRIFESSPKLF